MIVSFKYSDIYGFIDIRIASGQFIAIGHTSSDDLYRDSESKLIYSKQEIDRLNKYGWVNCRDRGSNVIYTIDTKFQNHNWNPLTNPDTRSIQGIYIEFIKDKLPMILENNRNQKIDKIIE